MGVVLFEEEVDCVFDCVQVSGLMHGSCLVKIENFAPL